MKLYEHLQNGGCMQDFLRRQEPGDLPEEDIDTITMRFQESMALYLAVVFGDSHLMELKHFFSICDSLLHHKDVEVRSCRDGIAIVELTRKRKEITDRVSGGRPGAVYRPAGRPPGQVNNMTVR